MNIDESARKIVEILHHAGYVAYFAGGWVRDYLMKHPSLDIDIATNATPEVIQQLFKKTIPVGIHFGVVIVVIGGHQFEVSTFRSDLEYLDGRRPAKIVLTNAEEDAKRRDFTINGLFYDPVEKKVIDYVGGRKDIEKGVIRTIGEPWERFKEDRLRMIRAVRFAARFNYVIEEKTRQAITEHADTLFPAVAMERVWQEFQKMAFYSRFDRALEEMHRLGLLQVIFPRLFGVSIEEIKRRVSSYKHFPKNCPPIVYMMELFPHESADTLINICLYVKASNKDAALIAYIESLRKCAMVEQPCEERDWVKFYAHPLFDLAIQTIAARVPEEGRTAFLALHAERKKRLSGHIERMKANTPLITSAILKAEGIVPGKLMGVLLDEAERIAVNQNIEDANQLLSLLKETNLWPG